MDQGVILNFKLHLQQFLKRIVKNETASFTTSRYENWFMKKGKSLYLMKRVICSAAKLSLYKTKQKTPRFDAPKAYHDALPVNSKKYDGDMKMA
jgi:hypothetical protein